MMRPILLIFLIFSISTNADVGESCDEYNWLQSYENKEQLLLLQSQVTALKLASLIEIYKNPKSNEERERAISFLSKIGSPLSDNHPLLKSFENHKYHHQLVELINESRNSLSNGRLSIGYENMPLLIMAYEMSTSNNIFNKKDFAVATFWQDKNPNENLVNPILEQLITIYFELSRKEREALYNDINPQLQNRWQELIEKNQESQCIQRSPENFAYSLNCGNGAQELLDNLSLPFEDLSLEVMKTLNFDMSEQFRQFSNDNLEWVLHPPTHQIDLASNYQNLTRTYVGDTYVEYRNQKNWYEEIGEINNFEFLQTFKELEAKGPYLVMDKTKERIFLYESSGDLKGSIDTGLDTIIDRRADELMPEQKGAGAGIYELSLANGTLLTLKDQRSRPQFLETQNNGVDCFSGTCGQMVGNLDALLKRHQIELPLPFYILPQDENFEFVVKNNDLSFTTYQKLDNYFHYNFTPRQEEAKATKFTIEKPEFDTPFAREFLKALESEKAKIMGLYGLDNDEYNELAILSFGILGQESQFGSHWRYHIKENFPGGIAYLKNYKQIFNNFGNDRERDGFWTAIGGLIQDSWRNEIDFLTGDLSLNRNSRGPTQIKNVPDLIEENYPINKNNLKEPKNAALATIGFLAQSLEELKAKEKFHPAINSKNRFDYLHYIYMGLPSEIINATATPDQNIYYRNVLHYSSSLKIWEEH